MCESRLNSQGQVTIPLAIRIALNLKTGDKVHFVNDGDRAILVPARGDVYSLKGDKGKPLGVAEMREMVKSYVVRRYDEHREGRS